MVDAAAALALVLVDDGERGAGYGVRRAQLRGDFADQRRFSGAHFSAEGDYRAAAEGFDDRFGDVRQVVLRGDMDGLHLLFGF